MQLICKIIELPCSSSDNLAHKKRAIDEKRLVQVLHVHTNYTRHFSQFTSFFVFVRVN